MELSILIIVIPLLTFAITAIFGRVFKPCVAGLVGTIGLAISTGLSYLVAYRYLFEVGKIDGIFQKLVPYSFEWLRFSDKLHIDIGILLDPISIMMLVVVTTVSLMVHIYSMGYMKGEQGFGRYYAFLSLFTFSMLGLVVATNIFQMYIFWELVGVSSYLLIGFYYTKPAAVAASKKAFIVTRFADMGFLVGILILSYFTGTFDFGLLTADNGSLAVDSMAGASFMSLSAATWAMSLIFMGGAGKSAMFPLHIWLPDAMEGPTPVSALIHAATMVVAGVFLIARLFPIYYFAAPGVLTMIAYIGAFTSLFAAVIAATQSDIKKILAFSTISQIAYMMVALGISGFGGHDGLGYTASLFHLFTHAFFKALLFLGAGSIIHAVHSNLMGKMGGLRRYMPITHITFLVGCLAISGIPPFSGFFSKDEILIAAFHSDKVLFVTLWIVAGLTAFYMFRLYFKVFWNRDTVYEHPPKESPRTMLVPICVLALLSCCIGFVPFGRFISADGTSQASHIEWTVAIAGILVAAVGIFAATKLYLRQSDKAAKMVGQISGLYTAALNKFYIDRIWTFVVNKIIFKVIATPIAWFDRHVVDGGVNAAGQLTQRASSAIKGFQSGRVQSYAMIYICAVLIIALCALLF